MSDSPRSAGGPPSARHRPVLVREVIQQLRLAPGQTVLDGTVGAGGHSKQILQRIGTTGRLIGLDRDSMMLAHARNVLVDPNVILRQASYLEMRDVLHEENISQVDRLLLDLGLSSDQLADRNRGFGIDAGGPLDMRFDPARGVPARELLETLSESELAELFEKFGEERFSREIAARIVAERPTNPVRTSEDLVRIVEEATPEKFRRDARKHSATRVFQALRIATNAELDHLQRTLDEVLPDVLKPGAVAVILTFHSLEDRLVKHAFRDQDRWHDLTTKPIVATPAEQRINPRSRTAKLRAAERR